MENGPVFRFDEELSTPVRSQKQSPGMYDFIVTISGGRIPRNHAPYYLLGVLVMIFIFSVFLNPGTRQTSLSPEEARYFEGKSIKTQRDVPQDIDRSLFK